VIPHRTTWQLSARGLLASLLALSLLAACDRVRSEPPPDPPTTEPPIEEPAPPEPPREPQGVAVIFDTDFGIDVDDVGALAVLHALEDMGEVETLAVVANVNDKYAPGAIDAVNTYYGRPDIPIGQTVKPYYSEAYPYWREFAPRFVRDLALSFPNDMDPDVPASGAVPLYRELLAAQPDGSVTVVAVGFLQNLADLLASGPDRYSSLEGRELVRRKVKHLVLMGGQYPSSDRDLYLTGGREIPPSYAVRVLEDWPTPIVFNTGNVCEDIFTGSTLSSTAPEESPVRAAYEIFSGGKSGGRDSWDLCSVLYAVRGPSHPEDGTYFEIRTGERLTLTEAGYSEWVTPGNSRHQRLVRVMEAEELAGVLEALLTRPPKEGSVQ